ncbi:MAG: chemotaxis protein CheW [Peptococcaceae bacterium]|nr:chemotaxis protein CheW [Peptococcaceae bacterium]
MAESVLEELDEELEDERPESDYPLIIFSIDGTFYGISSKYSISIEMLGDVTPIMDESPYCPGITNFRGDMINLLDLRNLFGLGDYLSAKDHLSSKESDEYYMLIVVESEGNKRGIIVDEIVAVEYITEFVESLINDDGGTVKSEYVQKVAKREKIDCPVLIVKHDVLCSV